MSHFGSEQGSSGEATVPSGTAPRGKPSIIWASTYRRTNRFRNTKDYIQGAAGEDAVVEVMEAALDERWTIFRNVVLPGTKGDIDVVLVGPTGVWAVEIKAYTSIYKVVDNRWEWRQRDGRWHRAAQNPSAQAERNAVAVHGYLTLNGVGGLLPVRCAVVLALDTSMEMGWSSTEIWTREHLKQQLWALHSQASHASVMAASIVQVLKRAVAGDGISAPVAELTTPMWAVDPSTPIDRYLGSASGQKMRMGGAGLVRLVWVLLEVVGTLIVAVLLWLFLVNAFRSPGALGLGGSLSPGTPPSTVTSNAGDAEGTSVLQPARVTASGTAPASKDSKGNTIRFDPSNVIDGDLSTAWRVPGTGISQYLLLDFDTPVQVSEIGLLPGYAKIDPYDKTDRFKQNRRVQRVRYEFDGGRSVEQTFIDAATLQLMLVQPAKTKSVKVVIEQSSEPGTVQGRDFVAISEVVVKGQ